jgi:hypothetical protein
MKKIFLMYEKWKIMDEFNPLTKCGQINKLSDDRWISSMHEKIIYIYIYIYIYIIILDFIRYI